MTEELPQGQDGRDEEQEEATLLLIAKNYIAGRITDDIYSEENNLSGFEQVIASEFELDPQSDWFYLELDTIREQVKRKIQIILDGGAYLAGVPIEINQPMRTDEVFISMDGIEFYIIPEIYDVCIDHFGSEEDYLKWIDNVSKNVFNGIITDDNPSEVNGTTGFDQCIISKLCLNLAQELDQAVFFRIKSDILSELQKYSGGTFQANTNSKILDNDYVYKR
jgi:hypothetical protein